MEKRKLIYFKSEDAKAQKRSLTEGTGTEQASPCLFGFVFSFCQAETQREHTGAGGKQLTRPRSEGSTNEECRDSAGR